MGAPLLALTDVCINKGLMNSPKMDDWPLLGYIKFVVTHWYPSLDAQCVLNNIKV